MAELTQNVIDLVESLKWDEDVRQDFYEAWLLMDEAPQVENEKHLRAFCNGYFYNLYRNDRTKEANRRRILEELPADESQGADPMDILIHEEELQANMDDLSPLLRDTLLAVVVSGLSVEEVAAQHGVSTNVIYKRVHDARQQMRKTNGE